LKIQILVDNKFRDFHSTYLVKRYVEENSRHKVVLTNKMNYDSVFNFLKPDIIILPHSTRYLADAAKRYVKNADVYLMPTEGGFSDENNLRLLYTGGSNWYDTASVKKVYVWGPGVKKGLLKTKLFNDEQLVVSGNPRFDLSKTAFSGDVSTRDRCGIGTTLKILTTVHEYDTVYYITKHSDIGTDNEVYWNIGGQMADFIWYEVATIELINHTLNNLKQKKIEDKFYLRPHPLESVKVYQAFKERFDIKIVRGEPIFKMLKHVYVYISAFSTSSFDALMSGVPSISFKKLYDKTRGELLIPEWLFDGYLEGVFWEPETYDELFDLIGEAKNGRLDSSPNRDLSNKYLQDNYNYLENRSATQIIGDDIINSLSSRTVKNRVNYAELPKLLLKETARHFYKYKSGDYNYRRFAYQDVMMKREISAETKRILTIGSDESS
jgi:surface carbohydrate biosynthesis protein